MGSPQGTPCAASPRLTLCVIVTALRCRRWSAWRRRRASRGWRRRCLAFVGRLEPGEGGSGWTPAPFTASEARRAIGLSRRWTLPILNHLDSGGLTTRRHDSRRSVRLD
ncbi:MAG: SelB C-terminal domain-containing protein [Actinomycetia bacterium]|nr:SelB C-terminal domain-containing protein [Actinomycetes bacterium]